MLKIKVEKIVINPIVGIYENERLAPQELWVDLEFKIVRISLEDGIKTTLDYAPMVEEIVASVNKSSFFLIETLAEYVLDVCVSNQPLLKEVKLRLYKPSALKNGLVCLETERLCSY